MCDTNLIHRCTVTNICPPAGSGRSYRPGVVLENLPRVREEASPELRPFLVPGVGSVQNQLGFTAASLHTDHSVGRRHDRTDATEAEPKHVLRSWTLGNIGVERAL